MRTLVLIRHAKAEAYSPGLSDETRALVDRGRADCLELATHLKSAGIVPDLALVSPSRRTRETFRILADVFGDVPRQFVKSLYLAEQDEIVAELETVTEGDCVIVIGHNPGLHDLALELAGAGGQGNYEAQMRLQRSFPTSAAAIFSARHDANGFRTSGFALADFILPLRKQ